MGLAGFDHRAGACGAALTGIVAVTIFLGRRLVKLLPGDSA
jgi:hypothetical protein